jgi:hypothetical protein
MWGCWEIHPQPNPCCKEKETLMTDKGMKVTEGWTGPGRRDAVIELLKQLLPLAEAHQNCLGPTERL